MKASDGVESFLTSREACDAAGYSRPSSFLRAWRAAGLLVYEVPSGRKLISCSDFENFIGLEAGTNH